MIPIYYPLPARARESTPLVVEIALSVVETLTLELGPLIATCLDFLVCAVDRWLCPSPLLRSSSFHVMSSSSSSPRAEVFGVPEAMRRFARVGRGQHRLKSHLGGCVDVAY